MLSEREQEKILAKVMLKFYQETNTKGWRKADIEKEVMQAGGNKNDLYKIIEMGFNVCCSKRKRLGPLSFRRPV